MLCCKQLMFSILEELLPCVISTLTRSIDYFKSLKLTYSHHVGVDATSYLITMSCYAYIQTISLQSSICDYHMNLTNDQIMSLWFLITVPIWRACFAANLSTHYCLLPSIVLAPCAISSLIYTLTNMSIICNNYGLPNKHVKVQNIPFQNNRQMQCKTCRSYWIRHRHILHISYHPKGFESLHQTYLTESWQHYILHKNMYEKKADEPNDKYTRRLWQEPRTITYH